MTISDRLFGTDGIRSEFGVWPLTAQVIDGVSRAAGIWLRQKHPAKKKFSVVIGKDTRASCNTIERLLAAGFSRSGIAVLSAGVIPTPGLAFLTNVLDVEMGIMISASHNPAADNGIKFFKHNGFKLSEKEEREIERIAFPLIRKQPKKFIRGALRRIPLRPVSAEPYVQHLKACLAGTDLRGLRVAVDCAHGAVSGYAGRLLRSLGATVFVCGSRPDGLNINRKCGSLHPQRITAYTVKKRADVGCSFDGDGDRVIFSDEKGRVLDGDHLMAMVARYFLDQKKLAKKIVVGTSMSNFGLEKFLDTLGVKLVRADVGDKYVLEQIIAHKANFGGEQSGHIIFLDHATTGDGMLTALQMLAIMRRTRKKPSRLAAGLIKYPQLIHNVRVREKKDFKTMPAVWKAITDAEKKLSGRGRLVMRYSGTERLARVMVEGENLNEIRRIADTIGAALQAEIGVE